MSMMYYPKLSKQILASAPHPEGTEYKISIGEEDWNGTFCTVVKVQMVYNGKISGRKSPSYPIGTDDYNKVYQAIAELEKQYTEKNKRRVTYIPAKKVTYVPVSKYLELIRRIPTGFITRWEDMDAFLKKAYSAERVEVEPHAHWPEYLHGKEVPYWRIVGSYGFVPNDTRMGGRDRQIRALRTDGLEIEPCGAGDQSRRVKNYKQHLFDLKQIPETEILESQVGSYTT